MAERNTTNAQILEAVGNDYSLSYTDRIDTYTQTQIANIASNWIANPQNWTAFNEALTGLITEMTIESDMFENPLAELERDEFAFGEVEEEVYVNFAKGYRYDPFAPVSRAFAIYRAYILSLKHHVNFERQYAVTIDQVEVRKALFNTYGLQTLMEAKMRSLRSGYNYDVYITVKQLVVSAYNAGMIYPVHVDKVIDEDTALELLVELQDYATLLTEPNPLYNIVGSTASVQSPRDLILITTSGVNARLKVFARSHAYHIEQLDNEARKIVVSFFNQNQSIQAILADPRWFHIRNQYETVTRQHNAAAIYDNNFLTGIKMISYSGIFPIVVFTTDEVITSTIEIESGTAKTGEEYQIDVTVTDPSTNTQISLNTFDLEISGQTSAKTVLIPGAPMLIVGDDEKATTLEVTGYLRSDIEHSKPATATITIQQTSAQTYLRR